MDSSNNIIKEELKYLKKIKFKKQLNNLKQELKNKTIVIYGAGRLFCAAKNNYDFKALDVIGLCDKKFDDNIKTFEGYNTISIDNIKNINPDYILVALKSYNEVLAELKYKTFFGSKTKIIPLFTKPKSKRIMFLENIFPKHEETPTNFKNVITKVLAGFYKKHYLKKNKEAKILVCLHIFYPEMWNMLKYYLNHLEGYNYDLIISTAKGMYTDKLIENIKKFKPEAIIKFYPNHGFDIAPFLDILSNIDLDKYDIVYKLHAKGINRESIFIYNQTFKYEDWFLNLYNGILGTFTTHKTIDALYNNEKTGLVASKNLIINDPKHKKLFTNNIAKAQNIDIKENYKYVAGTCFAAKSEALKQIQKTGLKIDDFSKTKRGNFSKAHAMERIICANIEAQNYELLGNKVKHPKYFFETLIKRKQSTLKLLDDKRFKLDYDFFYKVLEMRSMLNYNVVKLKLKDIKRLWHDEIITIKDCHPYKYLQGEKAQYKDYCIENMQSTFYMSIEKYENLIKSIENKGYDRKYLPVVNMENVLYDGQHRVSFLMNKYGENYEIECLQLNMKN